MYELAQDILKGNYTIQGICEILSQTVLRRGAIFTGQRKREGQHEYFELTPTTLSPASFADIAGYEPQKDFYRKLLAYIKEDNPILHTLRMVIVAGKPGVGKSLGVRALLHNLPKNARGIDVKITSVGANELDDLNELARKHPELHIVAVLEDVDAQAGDRSKVEGTKRFLQFGSVADLTEKNLHIIATTNRPGDIDPAVIRPGRVAVVLTYPLPQEDQDRKDIIVLHAKRNGIQLGGETLDLIIQKTRESTPDEIGGLLWTLKFNGIINPLVSNVNQYFYELNQRKELEK